MPLGYTQVNNDLATVQFVALYGIFWLLLWRPATRAGQVCAPVIMLGATLTSILPVLPRAPGGGPADRRPVEDAIAVAVCWARGPAAQWTSSCAG